MEHYKNKSLQDIVEVIDGITYVEQWRDIEGYCNKYMISSFGRVKRKERRSVYKYCKKQVIEEKILSPGVTKKGYLRIALKGERFKDWKYIHRLVAIAFIEQIDGKPCVNHSTGCKLKNHYTQLDWCTDAENNKHASLKGLFIGTNGHLTKEQRIYIWDNFVKIGREELAKEFNKSEEYIVSVFVNRGRNRPKISLKKLGVSKKVGGKNCFKKVIDTQTGEIYTTQELAEKLNTRRRYVCRMLNEDRGPNQSPYRYA